MKRYLLRRALERLPEDRRERYAQECQSGTRSARDD